MGFAFVVCDCYVCGSLITCNPIRVPSIKVDGVREPVCRACIEKANPERVKRGLEPFVIAPDAYEAVDEAEL